MRKFKFTLVVSSICLILATLAFPLEVSAKPLSTPLTPQPAGATGLTAAYIAQPGENISGLNINASTVNGPYDIGIYIAVDNVTVTGTNVSGANNEGILVQNASNVVIKGSKIKDNATDQGVFDGGLTPGLLTEDKGIVLAGTTNCIVQGNLIEGNGHGGIAVLDDGPNHPFAPNGASGPTPSTGNIIKANTIQNNPGDCAIVVAAKNPGAGVFDNKASENIVNGGVGGIVVAGGAFGPVMVTNTIIQNNVVTGGFIPAISLHAFGPGTITSTKLIGNVLSSNGVGELSGETTGIEIFAVPGVGIITGTQVLHDNISNDHYGVWHVGDDATTNINHLNTKNVPVPIGP